MRKAIVFVLAIVVGLSVFLLQAQAQFNVRAASDQPIAGWDRMDYDNHAVWVSPAMSLTSADILLAETTKGPDGRMAVSVIFTEAGAKKMTQLSTAQLNKLIAMVLDGKVMWYFSRNGNSQVSAVVFACTRRSINPEGGVAIPVCRLK